VSNVNKIVYCPDWSQILGIQTACLSEKCSYFLPPQNIDGVEYEGVCSKVGVYDCLCSIMFSLGIISGQIDTVPLDDGTDKKTIKEPGVQYG
jgi:hypothetical protein